MSENESAGRPESTGSAGVPEVTGKPASQVEGEQLGLEADAADPRLGGGAGEDAKAAGSESGEETGKG